MKSPPFRQVRDIEIDLGMEKIKISKWEKRAIILIAEGAKHKEVAATLGMEEQAGHMRLSRLKLRAAKAVGMYGPVCSVESVLCRIAYKGGLVRL